MAITSGKVVYKIYRALTYGLSPLIRIHLRWRKIQGREHPLRWPERLGRPSANRPTGPLIWFHAVSLGEGLAAIPVIKCCLERKPDVNILMTTTTTSAFEVIKERLPNNVIHQFAPLDIPSSMDAFLQHWRPNAIILMESELWPNLIMGAAQNGIALALLNGRMSTKSFRNWSHPMILPLIKLMLSKFSLILPLSIIQGIQFQLLQAPPHVIHYSGDLKCGTYKEQLSFITSRRLFCTHNIIVMLLGFFPSRGFPSFFCSPAIADYETSLGVKKSLKEFQALLSHGKVWMASSIHKGEEEVFIRAHKILKQEHPDLVTIIVPRKPHHGKDIALKLWEEGTSVALRSSGDNLTNEISIYVVDSLGELRDFYNLTPIAVVGGSFLPGSAGHNILEAAAAGCAVLTGHHVGHFSHMIAEMQRVNPLSVLQVSSEKLVEVVNELFVNAKMLEARRVGARNAYHAMSSGIVENLWGILQFHIFMKLVGTDDGHSAGS